MALRSFAYQDPFWVVARREAHQQKQEASCGQCLYRLSMRWQGTLINRCELKKYYGKRCLNYRSHQKKP